LREKELRLALVFFGGVSLAVYMHGISKEILKLVRASAALHGIVNRTARSTASFYDKVDRDDPEYDTEAVYFDLLREIGRKIDLRVIVDIVAGASAGGINGVMLARAIAHDLPMGKLRDLWLREADISGLLAPDRRAKAWSKWFLQPFLWLVLRTRFFREVRDAEMRSNLSLFVRSRWFRPPLDGLRMAALMLDAVRSMGEPRTPASSLLPSGHQLELLVTVTDFFGYQQLIQIHDPPFIREREHRHILRFSYRRWPGGEIETDFDLADSPALAFAARATSAFPGAFPPAQLSEIDRLLAARGVAWPNRARFIARNFQRYHQTGMDPEATSFIDGSVLANKPFNEAIRSIGTRAAYRQVDRRLVYVEPDPARPSPPASGRIPGFFSTLKGALSDIPRNEPIADELGWIDDFNERVRRRKAIIEAARPQIAHLVADVIGEGGDDSFTIEQIRVWREAVNVRVAQDAGFAYEGYVRLKLSTARAFVAQLTSELCNVAARSPAARAIEQIIEAWARASGIIYAAGDVQALRQEVAHAESSLPRWVKFLLAFDVDYRKRRLGFLIQGQNRLYEMLDDDEANHRVAAAVDRLKRDFYDCLENLRRCEQATSFSAGTREAARALFADLSAMEHARHMTAAAQSFAAAHLTEIEALVRQLAFEVNLNAATHDVDVLLAKMDPDAWSRAARREVLVNYLGFPFWDVLTFSVTSWRDAGEFDEIRVDRISPEEARTLHDKGLGELKGISLDHFGALFSRAYRENDYLLGRLQAADRLIDIVCDAAGIDCSSAGIDLARVKERIFKIILDAEEPHLGQCKALIAVLRERLISGAGVQAAVNGDAAS